MQTNNLKILIYGDVNTNHIDGSSIWLSSITETLAHVENFQLTLLLKSANDRDTVIENLYNYDNVNVLDPFNDRIIIESNFIEQKSNFTLKPDIASKIIDYVDEINNYDLIIVRGYNLSKEIIQVYKYSKKTIFYLTDFPQEKEKLTDEDIHYLKLIYENSAYLGCQTHDLINYFKVILNTQSNDKFLYMPPMVPEPDNHELSFMNINNTIIYAGKLAPLWKIPDMFKAYNKIKNIESKFIVAGDKFHNYPFQFNYKQNVEDILINSDNIVWKKGLSRGGVQSEIQKSDIGISWREKELDDSLEISTKVLEFGINGKPVIMNRNELHVNRFGEDYPLYANTESEFIEKIELALNNNEMYTLAAKKVHEVSSAHSFINISLYLEPLLIAKATDVNKYKVIKNRYYNKIKLTFAGHDLKFAKMLIKYFSTHKEYIVKIDQWESHNNHDETKSSQLAIWADVIIAEWGLGNAVWYSNNIEQNKKMIVRMHLQEKSTEYPLMTKWDSVDKIVFIAQGIKNDIFEAFPFLEEEKTTIISNLVDTDLMDKPKLPHSNYNLGMQGICPSRKRLDIALDIFEKLWKIDNRYTLFIKGKLPTDYTWLWNRTTEREYYMEQFKRINSNLWGNSVIFEGWGDVSEWYQKLNFVLSPSDFESFHLSIAEGMAGRTVPIIRDWEGADLIYEGKYIYSSYQEVVDFITSFDSYSSDEQDEYRSYARDFIVANYDKNRLCAEWDSMIKELVIKSRYEI